MSYLNIVGCADAIEWLAKLPANSVDSVVCDPPYGLGEPPPPLEVLGAWVRGQDFHVAGAGFMGKAWDAFVPQPSLWRAVYRVLKPGGYLLAFFGSRTFDWGSLAIRIAGFEVTDSLQWLYGKGFPKGLDVAKAVDAQVTGGRSDSVGLKKTNEEVRTGAGRVRKKSQNNGIVTGAQTTEVGPRLIRDEPATSEGARWKGWNTSLKPAFEPIVMARKPMIGTYAENVLEHGVGALNIGACRIGADQRTFKSKGIRPGSHNLVGDDFDRAEEKSVQGRWPANVVLAHSPECRQVGHKQIKSNSHHPAARGKGGVSTTGHTGQSDLEERRPGQETVENWECAAECPIKGIDAQSGVSKSSGGRIGNKDGAYTNQGSTGWSGKHEAGDPGYGDSGGASRFFYTSKASTKERWCYCRRCKLVFQRSDEAEKDSHADHADEVISHPTQKPVDLMEWLVRLVTPAGGIVLDPFCGTGTTAVASKKQGFNFVTCDIGEDYVKIAEARLAATGMTEATQTSAGYFCPGCKAKGEIKLLDKSTVVRARSDNKKITCTKCMGRFSADDLGV